MKEKIGHLKYSAVQTAYFPDNLDTEAQWIYYPDPELSYHRILVRHNFCNGSKGYWTENVTVTKSGRNNRKYLSIYEPVRVSAQYHREARDHEGVAGVGKNTPRVWSWKMGRTSALQFRSGRKTALKMAEELNSPQ